LFALKLLGSSTDHETYAWDEFRLEIMSFTRETRFGILGFFGFKSEKIRFSPLGNHPNFWDIIKVTLTTTQNHPIWKGPRKNRPSTKTKKMIPFNTTTQNLFYSPLQPPTELHNQHFYKNKWWTYIKLLWDNFLCKHMKSIGIYLSIICYHLKKP
jgi:hypothetical protein